MGYELDRLMSFYGVSTPSLTFTGSPQNEEDTKKFEEYKKEYQRRIAAKNIYDMLYPPQSQAPTVPGAPELRPLPAPGVLRPPQYAPVPPPPPPPPPAVMAPAPSVGESGGTGGFGGEGSMPAASPYGMTAEQASNAILAGQGLSGLGLSGVGNALSGVGQNALSGLDAALMGGYGSQANVDAAAAQNAGVSISNSGIPGMEGISSLGAPSSGPAGPSGGTVGADGSMGFGIEGGGYSGGEGYGSGVGFGDGSGLGYAHGGLAKLKRYQYGGLRRSPESEDEWSAWRARQGTPAQTGEVSVYDMPQSYETVSELERMLAMEPPKTSVRVQEPAEETPINVERWRSYAPTAPVQAPVVAPQSAPAQPLVEDVPLARPPEFEKYVDSGPMPEGLDLYSARPAAPEVAAPVASLAAAPVTAPSAGMPSTLEEMISKYTGGENLYAKELAEARGAAKRETDAFYEMLSRAIAQPSEKPDKAEMYFRLAAAFGAPTKTGHFAESLANVGKTLAEQQQEESKQRRAERERRLTLGLEAQKARMTAAKEDVTALRQLVGEEMKDKRTIATELLKDWVKRNDPVSAAGKQAKDEGLKVGTPEYQKRVKEISDLAIERQTAQINATVAGMNAQMANLALAQLREQRAERESGKLTPAEVKLKTETADLVASADSAMSALKQAYRLNPNTFDTSAVDTAQRKVLEAAGSKDPKLLATRQMENLLAEQALEKLKATFGSAPTEGERKILLDLQGIGAKSKEERAAIMRQAFNSLQTARQRHQKRLNEIEQGLYRNVKPADGGLE